MQEGCPPERTAVGKRRGAFCRIEDQLNLAVRDGVHDMRAALQHLVDLAGGNALLGEIALSSGGCDNPETEVNEKPNGFDQARLVVVLDRDEDRSLARQARAPSDLAFGEGDGEITIDAHDLAGRFHFRAEHRVDPRKACEWKYRLLHADMVEAPGRQPESGKRFAGHYPGGDLGD